MGKDVEYIDKDGNKTIRHIQTTDEGLVVHPFRFKRVRMPYYDTMRNYTMAVYNSDNKSKDGTAVSPEDAERFGVPWGYTMIEGDTWEDPSENSLNWMLAGGLGTLRAFPMALNGIKEVLPYTTARGWLSSTAATNSTPAWLTPKTAALIDATLFGAPTGASMHDWYQNGPTVENVVGTAAGLGGLAIEAWPTLMGSYKAYKSEKDFINNFRKFSEDYSNRLVAQGHDISNIKLPTIDAADIGDYLAGYYVSPTNEVFINYPYIKDYQTLAHEYLGHRYRHSLANSNKSEWPLPSETFENMFRNKEYDSLLKYRNLQLSNEEKELIDNAYHNIMGVNPDIQYNLQSEKLAVNTEFRSKISQMNNYVTGEELNTAIDNTNSGTILKMMLQHPYTLGLKEILINISPNKVPTTVEELNVLASKSPALQKLVDNVKNAMKKVAVVGGVSTLLNNNEKD